MLRFDAPIDFDLALMKEYTYLMPYAQTNEQVTVLVVDPSGYKWTRERLAELPNLKILATPSTGNNHVDLDELKRRGIKFLSLLDDRKGLDTISASAEFTFKLLLDAMRLYPPRELQDRLVGLVGYGRIGKRMMRWCLAFGATVVYHDPYQDGGISLEALFKSCDAVVVCSTYNDETRGMIDGKLLRLMKRGAALVNTARGEIINERDLLTVMDERPELRVAVDVVCGLVDGTANQNALRARGAIVTDHIAGATYDSRTKAARIILNLLRGAI